jgi:hypothetical protein
MSRFDFVLSYWLFVWWILYYASLTPFNPKIFLALGLIENIGLFFLLAPEKRPFFVLVNTFIKVIPLYLVWNRPTKPRDIYAGLALFLIYFIWLKLNGEPLIKARTPLADFLEKFPKFN